LVKFLQINAPATTILIWVADFEAIPFPKLDDRIARDPHDYAAIMPADDFATWMTFFSGWFGQPIVPDDIDLEGFADLQRLSHENQLAKIFTVN
jgi:hypothetical protein